MLPRKSLISLTLFIGIFASGGASLIRGGVSAAVVDQHAYFNDAIRSAYLYRAWSLRPRAGALSPQDPYYEKQLLRPGLGGYAGSNNPNTEYGITYDPDHDTDLHRQDAAKLIIPAFSTSATFSLAAAIGPTDTMLHIPGASSGFYTKSILMDDEIATVVSIDKVNGILGVTRGMFGTTAVAHPAGTRVAPNSNSVPNNVKLPLNTSDGHSYFFTWDAYWTDSFVKTGLTNHKAFNFLSHGIWLEPQANYGGGTGAGRITTFNKVTDVAAFQIRSYNRLNGPAVGGANKAGYAGPGVTGNEPLAPQLAKFTIKPNRWIRFWVLVDQRPNDYDNVSAWIADEVTDPIQTHRQMPLSVRDGSISDFVLEFNTSTDKYVRGDKRDLVAYIRNFVALQDMPNPDSLLQRPIAGAAIGASTLAPPRNVRIVPEGR